MSYCEPEVQSCFENIIEIKGNCQNKTAYSGVYLDSVGIKLNEVDSIVGEEYESGEELFYEKRNFAIQTVASLIHTHLSENYKAKSLIESIRVGQFQDNLLETPAQTGKLKGIYVELCNQDSFVDFYLNFLEAQFNFTGDVEIFIYDTIQNKLLDTLTVSAVAQEVVQLYVNKTYKSNRKRLSLFIGYDSAAVPSYRTYTREPVGCMSCDGYWWTNNYAKICGATISTADQKILKNFTRSGETFGLSVNYSINCNHEDWLCSYGRALAIPIALYTAREIAFYAINISQRANPKTFIDSEKWKARFDQYDSDFEKRFSEVLNNVRLPDDRKCFVCQPKLVHAINLP
jgi:hypothetical protein